MQTIISSENRSITTPLRKLHLYYPLKFCNTNTKPRKTALFSASDCIKMVIHWHICITIDTMYKMHSRMRVHFYFGWVQFFREWVHFFEGGCKNKRRVQIPKKSRFYAEESALGSCNTTEGISHFFSSSRFIRHKSNASSLSSSQRLAAFQSGSVTSGAASSHF